MTGSDPRLILEADRRQTTERLAGLRRTFDDLVQAARFVAADDEHDPDGTTAFDRAQVSALIDQAEEHLRDLDDAVHRVETGSYGVCLGCGGPVGAARLEARPRARECVACAGRSRAGTPPRRRG